MKNSCYYILAALALTLSCTRTEEKGGTRRVSFEAVSADDVPEATKTVLRSNGSIYWSPGDAINLFSTDGAATALEAEGLETPSAMAIFTGEMEDFTLTADTEFWAVYPYDEINYFEDGSVTVTLYGDQEAVAGTFSPNLLISLARSKNYSLQFYNLCGGIKFCVSEPGITSASFRGNAQEQLAGMARVAFDDDGKPYVQDIMESMGDLYMSAPEEGFEVGKWYYFVTFPTTLEYGYTFSLYNEAGLVHQVVRQTPVTIKRSVWGKLTNVDQMQ